MSRIGKQPIELSDNIEAAISEGVVSVKGPKGSLSHIIHPEVEVEINDKEIVVKRKRKSSPRAFWGLTRALIANMVEGVVEGYNKKLEIEGVGFRAKLEGDKLVLSLGFSHPVEVSIPEGIAVTVEGNTINVSGIDKQLVGQFAAKVRSFKKPEPYKGKGIHYEGEHIRRKAGKKAVATT